MRALREAHDAANLVAACTVAEIAAQPQRGQIRGSVPDSGAVGTEFGIT